MRRLLKQEIVAQQVHRLRMQAGVSLRALAAHTGFSASFLSQVENAQVSPSISSMERIAGALGVTLSEFFAATVEGEGGLIVRAAERQVLSSSWSNAEIEALSLPRSVARLEVMLITLRPGGRSGKHPYSHPREEWAYVLQGEVSLTLGPEEHRLSRGDAATLLPGELRLWHNKRQTTVRLLIVSSPVGGPTQLLSRRRPASAGRAAVR
jgi:quercetin dioxygenase-like cupin family protein/DNA-binding XRE family transcriptional regulator